MARPSLGKVRRSQIIGQYGPGSIIDFTVKGAPVSVICAGLEEWPVVGMEIVHEPRLQKLLRVKELRVPPVFVNEEGKTTGRITGVRFPNWLLCSRCHALKRPSADGPRVWKEDGAASICASCTESRPGRRPVYAVPSRFVVACDKGHLTDFPWHAWVKHKKDCSNPQTTTLTLRGSGSGFANLIVGCPLCEASRSMDGAFGAEALAQFKCEGRRPWLPGDSEQCDSVPRTRLRGSSDLYFPIIASSLSIPPWSDRVQARLAANWGKLADADPVKRRAIVEALDLHKDVGVSVEDLLEKIQARLGLLDREDGEMVIRNEEYLRLVSGECDIEHADFEIHSEEVPRGFDGAIGKLVRVTRLREVRALKAFTRLVPPEAGEKKVSLAPISARPTDWLPAIDVRGEGIFLSLDGRAVAAWESRKQVLERLKGGTKIETAGPGLRPQDEESRARFVLIHSLAHALIRQLALDCGYNTASLRERLFVDKKTAATGVLIYTSSPDADGTLGGLTRQGRSDRFGSILKDSLRNIVWCASDPLCITGYQSHSEPDNIATCHACLLLPETSCEAFNRYLDRGTLVGTPHDASVGFFAGRF